MRIIRYLKIVPGTVALIVCLLVVQAFTDLSLPRYTSDIVDVGIQQSGIEHAAVDEMTDETFRALCMMVPEDDETTLREAYAQGDDGDWHLTDEGAREREELDGIVSFPLVAVHYAAQMPDFDLAQAQQAYDAGMLSKDQIAQALDQTKSQLGDSGDALVDQQAIAAARAESEAAGVDVSSVQMAYLLRTGAAMLGMAALGMAASIAVGFLAARAAAKVGRTLRGRLFRQVVSFSDAEIHRFSAASLITRGTNDIQQIQMVSVMLLRMVIYAPILAIGGIVMVSSTNAAMSWIIVLAVVCLFVVIGILMSFAMPKFKIMQKLVDRVNLVAREMLTGLSVVRAFDRQRFEEERFDGANTDLMRTQLFTNRVMTFMMPSMMLIMNAVSVLIVWVGGSYIDQGVIQTGDMIAFITYSMVIIMSFLIIGMVSIMLPRANVAAERIDEVLAARSSIEDPSEPRDTELPQNGGAEIAFHDVTFSYADAEGGEPVLSHIDFTVPAGTTCAFIGSTGSGKSTVAKLVMRFYDATEGSVTIDGIDVRELSQAAVRRTIGYVPQKAFLFSGTVASNIAYADESMGEERVKEAARIAQATEFVEAKEEGYDAPISQGGTNVSGGQRQRLAIARAIASGARALLFDDSFSALDYRTDATLRKALADSLGDRTLLIVAQRVATIMDADQIIVLDDGRMVGKGTHRELMSSCEAYREIALSQLSEEELMGGDAA